MIDASLWYMFPVGLVFSMIAMTAGIGGGVLYSPFLILVLKLDPVLAIASGLSIEFFSLSSGIIGYASKRSVNMEIVKKLIVLTVPATILGVAIGRFFSHEVTKIVLALLLFYMSYSFISGMRSSISKHHLISGIDVLRRRKDVNIFVRVSSFFGALFVGMASAGLGEVNEYNFVHKMNMPASSAAGTSVVLVAASAVVGAIAHISLIIHGSSYQELFTELVPIVFFAVPGVILGSQIGVRLSSRITAEHMRHFLGALFIVLACLMIFSLQ